MDNGGFYYTTNIHVVNKIFNHILVERDISNKYLYMYYLILLNGVYTPWNLNLRQHGFP